MSDSVQPHRWQLTRLPRPWDSPGKNTGVGCHFLLQCMKVKRESEVAQSCLTLSDPMDYSPPGPPSMGFSRQEYWSGVPFRYVWYFLMIRIRLCIFGRNGTKRSQVLHGPHQEARDIILSQYWWCPLWSLGQVTLFYPSTDDVHFDHLVSAKVLHWKVTVSPFLVFKYLTGWYSETILFCLRSSPRLVYHSLMILAWISFSNGYKMVVGEPLV